MHIGRTELLGVLRLEIHGAHHALLARPAGIREEDVDQRADDVQVLRVRQVVQEDEYERGVCPPADGVPDLRGLHRSEERRVGKEGRCAGWREPWRET